MSCCGGEAPGETNGAGEAPAPPAADGGRGTRFGDGEVHAAAAELAARRTPHCLATVVWRRAPTSAKTGARALVTADGEVRGFLGGACAEPAVLRVALEALRDGRPRLLCLGDEDDFPPAGEGREVRPVGCASEGALEVFIEPHLPPPQVIAVGGAPMAEALVEMAATVGFDALRVDPPEDVPDLPAAIRQGLEEAGAGEASFVVVATMGRYDEPAVAAALATGAPYVALVASRRRAESIEEHLRATGVSGEDLERLRAPAGLDLGPVRHPEIAVSVLAEIVQLRAAGMGRGTTREEDLPEAEGSADGVPEAVDPVCGMTVATRPAVHTAEHGGHIYHFCCGGCRERFVADPEPYLEAMS